jgi:hypothetical protein
MELINGIESDKFHSRLLLRPAAGYNCKKSFSPSLPRLAAFLKRKFVGAEKRQQAPNYVCAYIRTCREMGLLGGYILRACNSRGNA